MSGYKAPSTVAFWEGYVDINLDVMTVQNYSQFNTYYTEDIVLYNDVLYRCVADNGYKFGDIRIPMVQAWENVATSEWQLATFQTNYDSYKNPWLE